MRLLVTGSNGFVGSALCREALAHGHEVAALAREGANVELVPVGARLVAGDFTNEWDVGAVLEAVRPEAILHAAAIVSNGTPDVDASLRVNVEGTAVLLRAAERHGVRRWLQVSSMSAHEGNMSVYGGTKRLAEQVVMSGAVPWTIFRPSLVYGPQRRGIFHRLVTMLQRLPVVPLPGGGHDPVNPVHAQDVGRAFCDALGNDWTMGKVYELGGPEDFTFGELVRLILKKLGRRVPTVPVPLPVCRLVAVVGEALMEAPPLTSDNLEGMSKARWVNRRPAEQDLQFQPRSFEEGWGEYAGG